MFAGGAESDADNRTVDTTDSGPAPASTTADLRSACASCNLRELCLPVALSDQELDRLDALVSPRAQIKRGESLFRAADRFEFMYAVRVGFFKSCVISEDGREQVTGFHMAGELLGFDGIGSGRHACDAVALENSQVCVIPFAGLEGMAREVPTLQRHFHRIMGREIVREQRMMLMLGSMRAEQRVAALVLNLAQRLQVRGYSASTLVLRMTREEIGSFLGMKLETVSRAFSRLQADGILDVSHRQVRVVNDAALRQRVGSEHC